MMASMLNCRPWDPERPGGKASGFDGLGSEETRLRREPNSSQVQNKGVQQRRD